MPFYEVYMPKPMNKTSASRFREGFRFGAEYQEELDIINEAFVTNGDQKVFSFELSDLAQEETIHSAFTEALSIVNQKYRDDVYVRAFFDQTFEEEFYSFAGGSFGKFDSVDEIQDYRDMLAAKQKSADEDEARRRASRASKVAKKINEDGIVKYAIIRIRIEDKSHEPLIRKAFDEILSTDDINEKDKVFSSMMDSIINSGDTYLTDYSGPWRQDLQYDKGKIGDLDFLGNILEYELSRKSLKLLLSNAPHRRKKYLPLIWGLFGIFGEKVAIKIWSKLPDRTRILWHQEDNIMSPTKEGALEIDDWNFTNLKSLNCNYYDWDW